MHACEGTRAHCNDIVCKTTFCNRVQVHCGWSAARAAWISVVYRGRAARDAAAKAHVSDTSRRRRVRLTVS